MGVADDEVARLLAAGQVAEAAAAARAAGRPAQAAELYARVWDFAAAAACAAEAGDDAQAIAHWIDAERDDEAVRAGDRLAARGEAEARAAAAVFAARRRPAEAARRLEALGDAAAAAPLYARAGRLVDAGRLSEARGDEPEAGRFYERAIADGVDDAEVARAHLALGLLHGRRGRHDLAARHLQEALRAEPTRAEAARELPRALLGMGLRDAAVAALARARELDPSLPADLDAHLGLARADRAAAGATRGGERSAAEPEPLVGGRYRLGRLLGAGGSGRVHEAVDVETGRHVAVKLFFAAQARGHEAYARFVREARVSASLRHPHIVELFDFREDLGFFAMELMSGGTLADRLTPRMPAPALRRAALDVLAGLEAAHALGVVHRDLKPANVFFDERGTAKLGDFGVAHLLDLGQTQTGGLIGTLAYMSPEQVTGAPLTFAADLYALGVTLYHALTGRLPLPGPDFLAQHLGETPPPASSVWPDAAPWDALFARLLAKDPAARHASVEEVRAELSAIDLGGPRRVLALGGAGRAPAAAAEPTATPAASTATPDGPAAARPGRPTRPERYMHEAPLGATGASTLVRAVDTVLGRSVVLERFAEGLPDAAGRARLAALAAAQGPSFMRVLGWEAATRTAVYEAPVGETLAARLARGKLPASAVARLVAQLAAALVPLHAAGVGHGALGADRVLLDEQGAATLAVAGCVSTGVVPPAPSDDLVALFALAREAADAPLPALPDGSAAELAQAAAALAARLRRGERRRAHEDALAAIAEAAADREGARAALAALVTARPP